MSSILVILIGTVLVNAFLLMHKDEALGGDREKGSIANGIRIATASALTLFLAVVLTLVTWSQFRKITGDVLMFVYSLAVVIIAIGLHRVTRRRFPRLRRSVASSPILIVSNCLALGAILLIPIFGASFFSALSDALVLAVGFAVTLIVFVTLASRITESQVPKAFRVAPVTLVSAGLLALALMGFTGLVRA